MRGLSALRSLATCLVPSTASNGRRKIAALKMSVPLAALLLSGGTLPGNAQVQHKLAVQTTVMRPSSAPTGSSHVSGPRPLHTMLQPNGTPVNTGTGIVYTCDPTISLATCNYLNTTVAAYYNDTFTNANANIYIELGETGLGGSEGIFNFVPYSQYATAYGNIPNKSAIQTAALSALSTYDAGPYGDDLVEVTAALGTAFGFTPMYGINAAGTQICQIGTAGCYNGIITITNGGDGVVLYYDDQGGAEPPEAYDFYAVVEHETDEVLGTASCISTQGSPLADGCDPSTGQTGGPSAVVTPVRELLSSTAPSAPLPARTSPTTEAPRTERSARGQLRSITTPWIMTTTTPIMLPVLRTAGRTRRFRMQRAVQARMRA
jgi:hypothetical protein